MSDSGRVFQAPRGIVEHFAKIWDELGNGADFRWATVTQASPLRVRMDTEADPMPITPQTLVHDLKVGQRVWCLKQYNRVLIVEADRDMPWTNITSIVSLASGLTWASGGGIHACVRGGMTALRMEHALTRSAGFVDVPVSGNVPNTIILSGIPAQFRPSFIAPLASGSLGRAGAYTAHPDGTVRLNAISPSTTWASTTPLPADEGISFGGTYPR